MEVGKILFPVTSLGPGNRVGIWTTGCFRDCPGCANPDLQASDPTKNMEVPEIMDRISGYDYEGVTISGGEPFIQTHDLASLVGSIVGKGTDDILVYTGYTLDELEKRHDPDTDYVLSNISVLVDGPYIQEQHCENRLKGSLNQRICIFKNDFYDLYKTYLEQEKTINVFNTKDGIHFIGIPSKNYQEDYKKRLQEL